MFGRGEAGGGTPSEGVWGNAPSWRGRGTTLQQSLNHASVLLIETESGQSGHPGVMLQRTCRFCQSSFSPSRFHPEQTVCANADCRRRRVREYHRGKVAADPVYRQVCNDSSKKWRADHPHYWKQYRQAHPDKPDRNRVLQQARDQKRRVRDLANNHLALDLKSCTAGVWLIGPTASQLANNTLATTQVFIVEGFNQKPRNLANNRPLVSTAILPDNKISTQPC